MIQPGIFSGMRLFLTIWVGQLVSLISSRLTGFALGVWVYQATGSATQFALISVFTMLPIIIMTPFTGVLVDRWNRRTAMLLNDSGAAVCTLALAGLVIAD